MHYKLISFLNTNNVLYKHDKGFDLSSQQKNTIACIHITIALKLCNKSIYSGYSLRPTESFRCEKSQNPSTKLQNCGIRIVVNKWFEKKPIC